MKAKKIWGQHFLKDAHVIENIIKHLPEIESDAIVLEVGPGQGVLTEHLIDKYQNKFYAIEIDPDMYHHLVLKFPEMEAHFLNQNFLDFDFKQLPAEKFFVVGNFPYNISTQIVFKCLDHKNEVFQILGMFQKEVAQRIVSPHGSKTYGIMSVLCRAYYEGTYLFDVDKSSFIPPPEITSGVISLKRNKNIDLGCDEKRLKQIVKAAFNQRRKMLRNSLKSFFSDATLAQNPIFTKRPEHLSLEDYIELSKL